MVPNADTSEFATLAGEQSLNPTQTLAYVHVLTELQRTRPDFDVSKYRRDIAPQTWDALVDCDPERANERQEAFAGLAPEQLAPVTPEAAGEMKSLLSTMALPQRRAGAPMLIFYGGQDAYIRSEWTRDAIARSCAMGSRIAAVFQPDKGHEDVDSSIMSNWVAARFDGDPAPSTC